MECGGAVVFLKTDSSSLAEFVERNSVTHVFADADDCGIGKDMPKFVLVLKPEYMIQYLISVSALAVSMRPKLRDRAFLGLFA